MTRNLLRIVILATVFSGVSLFAQDHLLITEFVVTPTEGEFIEIFNPTGETVDLTNYYLTDAISSNDNAYINVVLGGFTVGSSDFMVKFPDATTIAPGQFLTVSFSGTGFMTTYGVPSDFEIIGDDASVTDMTAVDVGTGFLGLSNSGEAIIFFHWDGVTDLVQDVDIVVWGDQAEAVDKTGVSIDGPDTDTDASTYADDTPVANQTIIDTEDDGDSTPHDFGASAQRRLDAEDVENWGPGGNGITGHDETSEDLSYRRGIWSINEPATPGWRALGLGYTLQTEGPRTGTLLADSLTIADINFVRERDIGEGALEDSPFAGETVTVTGIVTEDIRSIFFGPRFGTPITDGHGGPWSSMLLFQNDSTVATDITAVEPGDKIKITGVATEFPAAGISLTEFSIQLDPVIPIELLEVGQPLPGPVLLTPGDIGAAAQTADAALAERWEMVFVRFEGLVVTANGLPGGLLTAEDASGEIAVDDFFNEIFNALAANGGVYPGLPPGTLINVNGYVRGGTSNATVTITPRNLDDIEVSAAPPEITNVQRAPAVPTSSDNVTVTADATDADGTITSANVWYNVDNGAFQSVAMTAAGMNYSGDIPLQADGSFVQYFVEAEDNDGSKSRAPSDTMAAKLFYFVADDGIKISDAQETPFADGRSGYVGLEVSLTGIVTSTQAFFSDRFISDTYYIQDGEAEWSGIQVRDAANTVALGDSVSVTGTIEENFQVTRVNNVTSFTLHSSGNPVPAPLVRTTGALGTGGDNPEAFESVLVEVRNVTVSVPFSDGALNFGEFSVTDGSGDLRIDDESAHAFSQTDTMWTGGESITFIRGVHHFHNRNYKIQPRNDADLGDFTVSVEDRGIPLAFDLSPNYPNPFNPETTIRYRLASQGEIKITIFNILGQRVRTLSDRVQPAGEYTIRWDGTSDLGTRVASGVYILRMRALDFVKSRKMLLLK